MDGERIFQDSHYLPSHRLWVMPDAHRGGVHTALLPSGFYSSNRGTKYLFNRVDFLHAGYAQPAPVAPARPFDKVQPTPLEAYDGIEFKQRRRQFDGY
jgi:hypothetical protein